MQRSYLVLQAHTFSTVEQSIQKHVKNYKCNTDFITAITFFVEDFTGGMGTNTQIRYPDRKKKQPLKFDFEKGNLRLKNAEQTTQIF